MADRKGAASKAKARKGTMKGHTIKGGHKRLISRAMQKLVNALAIVSFAVSAGVVASVS